MKAVSSQWSVISNKFFFAVGALLCALSVSVEAQQPAKVYKVGRLTGGSSTDPFYKESFEAFRQGLRELGWIEGQNILLEPRWTGEKPGSLRGLAADLVRLKVDVIVANGATMVQAAKAATTTIPIIMAATGADPVAAASSQVLPGLAETSPDSAFFLRRLMESDLSY